MILSCNSFQHLGLSESMLNTLAIELKFIKRLRKLNALDYIQLLIFNCSKNMVSYNTMASTTLGNEAKSVLKQSLHKAMRKTTFLLFIQSVFNKLVQAKLGISSTTFNSRFKRIIIQDSTIIKIPKELFKIYSGVSNGITQVSNARIQVAIDILSNIFTLLSIDSYSINDISAANRLALRAGDLVLRDRGYCSIVEIKRILESGADFIYRYSHSFIYYHIKTGEPIDLYKLLLHKRKLKIEVRLGGPDGQIVTLLAHKVKEEIANRRREKLKKTAKHKPSQEVLRLLSWSIFLTSIKDEDIKFEEVFNLYKLRWRIEILFKALKSHLNLNKIHNVPENQLKFIIIAKMMLAVIIVQFIYENLGRQLYKNTEKEISILRLTRYINDNMNELGKLIIIANRQLFIRCELVRKIEKYCTYDARYDRENYEQQLEKAILS
jgi:hypothetical protein